MADRRRPELAARLARRAPAGLLRRVRWLFLVFLLLVLGILLLDLPQNPAPWWPHKTVAAAATAVWALWGVHRYRRPAAPLVTDAVPVAALVVTGIAAGSPFAVFGPAFVTIYFRSMFGTRLQAVANAALLAGGFFAVLAYHEGIAVVLSLSMLLLLIAYLAVAVVMQALGEAAGQHERAGERERALTDVSGRLLGARSEAEVHRAAVEGAARMVAAGEVASSLWSLHDGGALLLVATSGPELIDLTRVPLDAAPPEMFEQFSLGEPYLIDPATTREMETLYGHPHRFHQLLIVPLAARDRLEGALVLASPQPLDEEVLEVMARFANEVLLGLDRVRLLEELHRANEDLRRADEVKNQFLSTVSHELRTPLTSIRGFADTLRTQWRQLPPDRVEQYLEIIERQARRQQQLVDDLLTTSQIMAGRLRVAPTTIAVAATVAAVAEELSLPTHEVRLVGDDSVRALVDGLHLHQILSNLLANARKYGAPPYEVHLDVDDDQCVMRVCDHGPGVPEPFQASLYEPFQQAAADDPREARSGVGLGLAIVRRLTLANGGSVAYRPDVAVGACFEIRLPLGREDEVAGPAPA